MKKEQVDEMCRHFVDQGRLIEAGWVALKYILIPATASAPQVSDMRAAYFLGAQHLFASIIGILEPGTEPTPKDLMRLTLIDEELKSFIAEMNKQNGSAYSET